MGAFKNLKVKFESRPAAVLDSGGNILEAKVAAFFSKRQGFLKAAGVSLQMKIPQAGDFLPSAGYF